MRNDLLDLLAHIPAPPSDLFINERQLDLPEELNLGT